MVRLGDELSRNSREKMKNKSLKFKTTPVRERRVEQLRACAEGDECKFQFMLWAEGTSLDVSGIHDGDPVFRPAICAWEAWKAAWSLLSDNDQVQP